MPQLDIVTLFSQVFWLLILYFLFFLIFIKYFLPHFSKVFKLRAFFVKPSLLNAHIGATPCHQNLVASVFKSLDTNSQLFSSFTLRFEEWILKIGLKLIFFVTAQVDLLYVKQYLCTKIKLTLNKKIYSL